MVFKVYHTYSLLISKGLHGVMHGQVIEMCSHAIFYISCVEREPGITQDYL